MDISRTITVAASLGLRKNLLLKSLIADIPIDLSNTSVSCISTYQANLYIGTSTGEILHYHKFEDAPDYILIAQLEIGTEKAPIRKLLILNSIDRLLILSGNTVHVYTIPELSTSRISKIKDVNDILYLAQLNKQLTNRQLNEKVIIFTSKNIRLVQFNPDLIKLLRDINYLKAVKGISCSSGTSTNYSNLALVANDKNYDIVDLQQTRKIPLFDYKMDSENVEPYILPFKSDTLEKEEYMLTVKSDDLTSLGMFINSLGDVTRGTLSWESLGYPSNGLVVWWPFIIGIFEKKGRKRLVFSCLESLEVCESVDVRELYVKDLKKEAKEEEKEEAKEAKEAETEEENVPEQQPEGLEQKVEQEAEQEEIEQALEQTDADQKKESVLEQQEELPKEPPVAGEPTQAELSQEPPSQHPEQLQEPINEPEVPDVRILQTNSSITLDDSEASSILSKTKFNSSEITPATINLSGSILLHDNKEVFLLYEANNFIIVFQEIITIFETSLHTPDLIESKVETLKTLQDDNPDCQLCILQMMDILKLYLNKSVDSEGNYQQGSIHPSITLYLLDYGNRLLSTILDDIEVFVGIKQLIDLIKMLSLSNDDIFYSLIKVSYSYREDLKLADPAIHALRSLVYKSQASDLDSLLDTIDSDKEFWKSSTDTTVLQFLRENSHYYALLNILLVNLGTGEDISVQICDMALKLLKQELSDCQCAVLDKQLKSSQHSVDLVAITFNELQHNFSDGDKYMKYLLEILKLFPAEGLEYLKNNKNSIHKSTHKTIMNEIDKSHRGQVDFSALKLEYLEASFQEEITENGEYGENTLDELLLELTNVYVNSENEVNSNNFFILRETYRLDHPLTDSQWPKPSWIQFLQINGIKSECQDFVILYLRIFELLLIRQFHNQKPLDDFKQAKSLLLDRYLRMVLEDMEAQDIMNQLVDFCDFSSAEFYALHHRLPYPTKSSLFPELEKSQLHFYTERSPGSIRDDLTHIFNRYMESDTELHGKILATRHIINSYGSEYFTPLEVLQLIPDFVPLAYVRDHILTILINSESTKRTAVLKKVLSRADYKLNERLVKELA